MTNVEARFSQAMLNIYHDACAIGYKPTAFFGMLTNKGATQTAKQLINAPRPSDGYTRLWELDRLDLSVEAVIHENAEWHGLFTEDELRRCKKRLSDYNYFDRDKR